MVLEKFEIFQGDFFTLVQHDSATNKEYLLDPDKTLEEVGVGDNANLLLRVKYFKMPFKWVDPVAVHLFYTQLAYASFSSFTNNKRVLFFKVRLSISIASPNLFILFQPRHHI